MMSALISDLDYYYLFALIYVCNFYLKFFYRSLYFMPSNMQIADDSIRQKFDDIHWKKKLKQTLLMCICYRKAN